MDIWIEKYRPQNLNDIVGQDLTIKTLIHYVETQNVPNLIFYGSRGVGKCHAIDTPILMHDGSIKKVQNIKIGDKLMGDDSTVRNVLSLGQGYDIMYKINPTKGESFIVNSEHILCLKLGKSYLSYCNQRKKYVVKYFKVENDYIKNTGKRFNHYNDALKFYNKIEQNQIVEISVKNYVNLKKSIKDQLFLYKIHVNFPKKEIPFDPYIIGLWLGDGSSRDTLISNQDSVIIKYLKETLPHYDMYLQYTGNQYDYRMNSIIPKYNKLFRSLKTLNLINNKHIPDIYKINSQEIRLQVLAGLLDSDGYCHNNTYLITQKNETLANDILYLSRSLGFAAYKTQCKKECWYKGVYKTGLYYRISIFGNVDQIPVKIHRKQALPRKHPKNHLFSGFKVEKMKNGKYYGFTLDKNHRYLMGDFTVSHNTSTIHALCKDLYGEDYKKYVLELNASHERGINTIRTKVKTMAQTKTSKIKMIILDEADSMTKEAMFSLRMIMENYSHITRFCLICNYINKIIDPLQSRCTVFYFQPLQHHEMIQKLKQINGKENKEIIKHSNGDMRRATMMIQYSEEQDIENLFAISEKMCDQLLNDLIKKPLNIILDTCFDIHKSAYDKSKIIELLGEKILKTKNIPNKEQILFLIGEKDVDIQQGMWDYIELVDLCSKIEFLIKNKNEIL